MYTTINERNQHCQFALPWLAVGREQGDTNGIRQDATCWVDEREVAVPGIAKSSNDGTVRLAMNKPIH